MSSLAAEERRNWLLSELRASKTVSLTDAAEALGVSEMTVRRDLNGIEASGVARRVRGGAVYNGPVSFQGRERSHAEEKLLVAEKLLPLVPSLAGLAVGVHESWDSIRQLASHVEAQFEPDVTLTDAYGRAGTRFAEVAALNAARH